MGYLESFHERTQPLGALAKVYARLADFDARFDAGEVPGEPNLPARPPLTAPLFQTACWCISSLHDVCTGAWHGFQRVECHEWNSS